MVASGVMFHVGAGISGVAPHYIPPPSTFNVLLGSYWTNVDPNNVPLASLVAQEEHVDVNFIKNNNFNNNAYRNNSSNNYRPYPYNNGNGYGNSYGNSYNNNRNTPPGLEAMLKEFISTQTAFNKSVEEKLGKIDILASKVDSLADVDLLKSKAMPNENHHNKIVTTANAIQVRINENIRLKVELRARWDREENEKLAKEKNVAKVWTITTTSNANATHVAAPPTINNKRIGVSNVSTSNAKREKLPETAKTAEIACDKTAEIFSNMGDDDPIDLDYNGLNFDDCHISEVIKFLQKLAKSPNASAINLAFTQHITNALIKAREEKLEREASIPRKLEDGWEPIIKMKVKDFDYLPVEIVPNPFLEGNIEPDPEEVDLVFDLSPSFAEVVAQVRVELNWNEPNDGVELEGRHNVGFGMHTRWKTMRINSEQRWSVYKETVAESQDKALELFATKTVDARIELDLNRRSSPVQARSPPPMSQEEATQSPIVQSPIAQEPPLEKEYDEHDDGDDGFEMNDNNVGDLDKYWTQEEMDHSIPYSRCYASDSDDDGPDEELDEDGLTAKEAERAEIFKKVTGRDIRIPLFRDVSLADGAVVDGGKSLLLGARPISKRDVDGRTAMISKGLTFDTFLELKIWLKEFSIKHHRPYIVVHSDLKKRYTLKCVDKRCPWVVRARPFKKGPSWHITSCVATHMCRGPKLDGKDAQPDHRQLTSEFIAYKLSAEISSLPTMSIRSVQDTVKSRFDYDVKYGKAWKAKQAAFKMLYGMATQPTKGKGAWEGNEKEETVWEEAVRTVRKREKEEVARKEKEEHEKKMAERARMQREYEEYIWREKKRNEKLQAERDRLWREKFQRNWQLAQLARERANRMHLEEVAKEAERIKEERAQAEASKTEERHHFFDSVVQLARDIREKEELAEESKKKKARGEGAFATQ
ncbi:hypothetical protein QYE76_050352 [Lolium multiflorum]|uniref:Transposase MuDR plant domain-containing protein n=1 Tax=Lolium multiflorum TaxID=4521 RepID=A0AAD8SRP6_LOLMU|nr:hypothetical protein QYE76_050352 [Lolium multiflorum]